MQLATEISHNQSSGRVVAQTGHVISICTDASDIERLRPEWELLQQNARNQDPFLSCDWFATWWRAFGGEHCTLFLVTARRHGHLRAVLPLMIERGWCHGIPVRRLVAIGNDHTPYFDLVRARDNEHLHRTIWNYLMTLRKEWDVLDLPRLNAESISADRFMQFARTQGVKYSLWRRAPKSPWIDIQPSWDEYLDSRSASLRKALRRKMRRLAERGRVGLETISGGEALERAVDDGLYIEAEGWKGSNNTAISSQPADKRFYTELAEVMAARGQLRLHFLTLDGERIAFDYSIVANRCLYSLKAGHSSAHAQVSPGMLLLGLILEQAHEEGLVGMDLLGDTDEFKMQWTDATRTHPWLHCFSDSLRGHLSHLVKCRLVPSIRA